jgi:hypothetical protein
LKITDLKKSKKYVKLEINFNKSVENSGKSDKNRTIGWSPKFATGLNVIIGIDQKIYE